LNKLSEFEATVCELALTPNKVKSGSFQMALHQKSFKSGCF
jgi:hypothetical protein